jgi:hypothetical protein
MSDKLINELLELWGNTIGCQHHKTRDFEFYIEKYYCCYQEVKYRVVHYGYILRHLPEYVEFETNAEAVTHLIKILIDAITEECQTAIGYETTPEDYYDLSKGRAQEILEKLNKLKIEHKLWAIN